MDFEEWEPLYDEILHDFGFSKESDERSARLLASIIAKERLVGLDELRTIVGDTVTVFGCGPLLDNAIESGQFSGALISAGGATTVLSRHGICPNIFVTDLDGPLDADILCNNKGSVAVIHAHGDNMRLIERNAGRFAGNVVITTQSRPFGDLINLGGFTDGDRAVMLARALGAKELTLVGFDFERPSVKERVDPAVKRRKLMWAKKLIFEFNPKNVKVKII